MIELEASAAAMKEDMGDGMQCSDHPYRNNPGGICAFCLQEKLGKLVSSSFPLPIPPPSLDSSSSPPSFRSDSTIIPPSSSFSLPPSSSSSTTSYNNHYHHTRRSRLPFLLAKKNKKKSSASISSSSSSAIAPPSASDNIIFKRSKSTTTPSRASHNHNGILIHQDFSPRKRHGFWSFLYLPSKSSSVSTRKLDTKSFRDTNNNHTPRVSTINPSAFTASSSSGKQKDRNLGMGSSLGTKITEIGVVEDDDDDDDIDNNSVNTQNTPSVSSFERKVSRSRSVGCGSRSFSGDFFERISTGFGDCTLRRVESQREGKPKAVAVAVAAVNHPNHNHHHQCMKERVKCAGIFSGFMMTSSSSSSSSSSYWVSSSGADDPIAGKNGGSVAISQGRAKNWGWAFSSPMRAFGSKASSSSSKENKRDIVRDASSSDHNNNNNRGTPNLSDIPSLLSVRV